MITEQAIGKAIEGGYIPQKSDRTSIEEWIAATSLEPEKILLDPLFWQALGKSMGWETLKGKELEYFNTDDNFKHYHHECRGRMWHYEWTRFIDHLAEGKTIKSYFETL